MSAVDRKWRGRTYDDFTVGEVFVGPPVVVTREMIDRFTELSGDANPLHTSEDYAATTIYRRTIAHGMLVLSLVTGEAHKTGAFEGTTLAFAGVRAKFVLPTYPGDSLTCHFKVVAKEPNPKPTRGMVHFFIDAKNQAGKTVSETEWDVLMRRA